MRVYNQQLAAEAIQDASEISLWYEKQLAGLGDRFLNELNLTLDRIEQNPFAFGKIDSRSDIRKCYIKQFQYKVYFNPSEEPVLILAIIHTARSKRYIRKRLR